MNQQIVTPNERPMFKSPIVPFPQRHGVTAADLRTLAGYFLAAAAQRQRGELHPDLVAQMTEWHLAADYVRDRLGEHSGSVAAIAAKRALGMLVNHQAARDYAHLQLVALLDIDESVKERLCDGDDDSAATTIAGDVIDAYLCGLSRGQL